MKKEYVYSSDSGRSWSWLWWAGPLSIGAIAIIVIGLNSRAGPAPDAPSGVETFSETGRAHVEKPVSYDRTPPAGGDHSGTWLNCGVYRQPVPNMNAVHSLEHGAVWITYRSSLPADQVTALQKMVQEKYAPGQRYVILSPYPDLPAPVVATAWGNQLTLQKESDDRLGQFIDHFRGRPPGPGARGELHRGHRHPDRLKDIVAGRIRQLTVISRGPERYPSDSLRA